MTLNSSYRRRFLKSLQANNVFLQQKSMEVVNDSYVNAFRVILDCLVPESKNSKLALEYISRSLESGDTPELCLRKSLNINYWDNEIKFKIIKENPISSLSNTQEEIMRTINFNEYQLECEKEFWENPEMNIEFLKIGNFESFADKTVDAKDLKKYNNPFKLNYNIQGWDQFLLDLLKLSFPDFQFSKDFSNKKQYRFLKCLGKGVFFGFEFNRSLWHSEIKTNGICLPNYFNIILINEQFDKNIDLKEYILKYNDTALSLGILGNPFFYDACIPLANFAAVEMHYDKNALNLFTYRYEKKYIEVDNDKIQIIHPKEYGDKLKRHAFYYLSLLKFTSQNYLDYIEKSI